MERQFTLRQFRIEDLDRVIYINRECLPENYSSYFFIDLFKRFPETFIIAEENGDIVGYIMCRIESGMPDFRRLKIPKIGHIISIAVLPGYRNRGIGRALISKALEAMKLYNAEECYLEVRVSNTPAINLYRKLGFKVSRRIRGYYSDGEDAYLMNKKLSN